MTFITKSNYRQFYLFVFMKLSNYNIFIYLFYLARSRMVYITYIYIQSSNQKRKIEENIFILISFIYFCSSLYFHNMVSEL